MVVSFQFGLEKIADAFQKRAEKLFSNTEINFKAFLTVALCTDNLFFFK